MIIILSINNFFDRSIAEGIIFRSLVICFDFQFRLFSLKHFIDDNNDNNDDNDNNDNNDDNAARQQT